MSVIAVIGSTGFIGTHLLKYISDYKDIQVRVLVHKKNPNIVNKNITYIEGDILTGQGLDQLFVKDAIVFNLAFLSRNLQSNIKATQNIIEACHRQQVKKLIHCSTAVVTGDAKEETVNELTVCHPRSEYEKVKLEVETTLTKNENENLEIVILRPTAVFGPGGQNLLKLAGHILNGNKIVNYFRSCVLSLRTMNLVAVENVVAALIFLAFYKGQLNKQVFIISDDDHPQNTYQSVESYLTKEFSKGQRRLFPRIKLPAVLLKLLFKLIGKPNPFVKYDPSKLAKLGFKKPISFELGLKSFAQWYTSQ